MGDNKYVYGANGERSENGRHIVHNGAHSLHVLNGKRRKKMFDATAIKLAIFDIFGGSFTVLGILNNLDNLKSLVLFILGAIYLGVRIYFTIIRTSQAVRKTELEIQDQIDRRKRSHDHGRTGTSS